MVFLDVMMWGMVHKHQHYGVTYRVDPEDWRLLYLEDESATFLQNTVNYYVYLNLRQLPSQSSILRELPIKNRPNFVRENQTAFFWYWNRK